MRDDFEPTGETTPWTYCDSGLEKVDNLPQFVAKLAGMVEKDGYLFLCPQERQSRVVKTSMEERSDFTFLEESYIDDRVFLVYCRGEAPSHYGVPEVLIYRGGGAIGDVYHAAAVAEEYAKQGFKVCFMAQDKVHHVFANNPHIKWYVPEPTMPNAQLFQFLTFWEKRARLMIVLDYSIEGFLLKQPVSTEYFWSKEQRERMCGKSYAQNVSDMAGLDKIARITHYASERDREEAQTSVWSTCQSIGDSNINAPFIFLQLGGSSDVHKWNPHLPQLCVMLLARTEYSLYLSFNNSHAGMAHRIKKYIEANYGETSRLVLSTSKRSFSVQVEIAKHAVCVMGPETGIMVALSHSEVRKVLLCSHSAPSNFNDWENTTFLKGDVPCSPCHRQHQDFTFCNKDVVTGAAACQAAIGVKQMFESVTRDTQQFRVVMPMEDAMDIGARIGQTPVSVDDFDTTVLRNILPPEPWPNDGIYGSEPIELIEADRPE